MPVFTADIHGHFNWLYKTAQKRLKTDAVIIAGDVEPLRGIEDVDGFAGTPQQMQDYLTPKKGETAFQFEKYWKKGKVPVPTFFVGGNHEPFGWLDDYMSDGPHELIKNFHFAGRWCVTEFAGLTVAALSGVDGMKDYPYKEYDMPGSFFTRADVDDLIAACRGISVDVVLCHDNPTGRAVRTGMTDFGGDKEFTFGSPLVTKLIKEVRPKAAVCGHMHATFNRDIDGVPVHTLAPLIIREWSELTGDGP